MSLDTTKNRRTMRIPQQPAVRCPEGHGRSEILVIIAIIVTLLLFLLPGVNQAREKARQATCLSNVRQIGIAILLYAQDYDDVLVPCQISDTTGNLPNPYADDIRVGEEAKKSIFFNQLLQPYIESVAVWRCKSNEGGWVNLEEAPSSPNQSFGGQNSYCANLYVFRQVQVSRKGVKPDDDLVSLAEIDKQTSTIAVAEGTSYRALPQHPCQLAGHKYDPARRGQAEYWKNIGDGIGTESAARDDASALVQGATRHGGSISTVFLDGHAKAMRYQTLVSSSPRGGRNSLWDPFKEGCE